MPEFLNSRLFENERFVKLENLGIAGIPYSHSFALFFPFLFQNIVGKKIFVKITEVAELCHCESLLS